MSSSCRRRLTIEYFATTYYITPSQIFKMNKSCHHICFYTSFIIGFCITIVIFLDLNLISHYIWHPGNMPISSCSRPSNRANRRCIIYTIAFTTSTMPPFIRISISPWNLKTIDTTQTKGCKRSTLTRVHAPLINFLTPIFIVSRIIISTRNRSISSRIGIYTITRC